MCKHNGLPIKRTTNAFKKESRAREVVNNWEKMCEKLGCPAGLDIQAKELLVTYVEGSFEETGKLECFQQVQ